MIRTYINIVIKKFITIWLLLIISVILDGCKSSEHVVKKNFISEKTNFINLMKWYDYFVSDKKRISLNFVDDSLDLKNDSLYYFTESELLNYYKKVSPQKVGLLEKYIESVHQNEGIRIQKFLDEKKAKWKPKDIRDQYDRTVFYYYSISERRLVQNFDKYSIQLKASDQIIYEEVNKIDTSLNEILFSNKFKDTTFFQVPNSLLAYLNDILTEAKSYIRQSDTSRYNKIKDVKISTEYKSSSTLWFSNNIAENKIFISPYIIRAIYILTFSQSFENLIATKESYKEGNYISFDLFTAGQKMDFNDYYIENKTFRDLFFTQLSFMLHHELAHIYLGQNSLPNLDESDCDCHGLIYYNKRFLVIGGGKDLGIYKRILEASIINNRPDLWGVKDISELKKRFSLVNKIFDSKVSDTFCDSLFKVNNSR